MWQLAARQILGSWLNYTGPKYKSLIDKCYLRRLFLIQYLTFQPMATPRVCAVVVTYNRPGLLAKGLRGLMDQSRLPDEILVVNNASTDGTAEMLATDFPEVIVHTLDSNRGASGGFSEGTRVGYERGFDWLWLLDDDIVAEPDCLHELLEVANASGKPVVTPRRRDADGTYPRNEAVIDETTESYACPTGDSRWLEIDIFTFEGPLVHRSVIDRIGVPNPHFFITGDDTEFSIRVYKAFGPLAGALANRTAVNRLLSPAGDVQAESRLKRVLSGDPTFLMKPDDQHWKHCYYLRNRHLIWKQLGWRKRRIRQLVIHAGYLFSDAIESSRRGWDWRLRLKKNAHALALGLMGKDGAFIDPAAYLAELRKRAIKP